MSQAIYVSDYSQYEILHNDFEKKPITMDKKIFSNGKTIIHFNPIRVYDPVKKQEVPKGLLILDTEKQPELVKYMDEYPDNGKGYAKVDRIPIRTLDSGSIITGPGYLRPDAKSVQEIAMKDGAMKGLRFGELKQKICKKDGDFRADATEEEITEFQKLQKELNLQ